MSQITVPYKRLHGQSQHCCPVKKIEEKTDLDLMQRVVLQSAFSVIDFSSFAFILCRGKEAHHFTFKARLQIKVFDVA